jgi:anti-sigma regulatory factor (Ser/Thr protein kinase)
MPGELVVKHDECRLAGEAAQVRAARRFVAELLGDDWPDVDAAVLLTSELAANAVLHSASGRPGGKFTVRATMQPRDYLWVEVEDEGGPWTQTPGDREAGHGLDIVRAIADDWGKDGGPVTGWIVWARVDWSPGMSGAEGASDGCPGPAPHRGAGTALQPPAGRGPASG